MIDTPIFDSMSRHLSRECQVRLRWTFLVNAYEHSLLKISDAPRSYEEQKRLYERWRAKHPRNYLYPSEVSYHHE